MSLIALPMKYINLKEKIYSTWSGIKISLLDLNRRQHRWHPSAHSLNRTKTIWFLCRQKGEWDKKIDVTKNHFCISYIFFVCLFICFLIFIGKNWDTPHQYWRKCLSITIQLLAWCNTPEAIKSMQTTQTKREAMTIVLMTRSFFFVPRDKLQQWFLLMSTYTLRKDCGKIVKKTEYQRKSQRVKVKGNWNLLLLTFLYDLRIIC